MSQDEVVDLVHRRVRLVEVDGRGRLGHVILEDSQYASFVGFDFRRGKDGRVGRFIEWQASRQELATLLDLSLEGKTSRSTIS